MNPADSVSLQIDAPPETLWSMVSDVTRMGEWSPETFKTFWVRPGKVFVGLNKDGRARWPTFNTVVASEPGRVFAFKTFESGVVWRYTFTPQDGGTLVTESRDDSREHTPFIKVFYTPMGGYDRRIGVIRAGMAATLARLKAAAEAG